MAPLTAEERRSAYRDGSLAHAAGLLDVPPPHWPLRLQREWSRGWREADQMPVVGRRLDEADLF